MRKLMFILLVFTMLVVVGCSSDNDSGETNNGSVDTEADTPEGNEGANKKLVMGTSADFPPFEYIDTAKDEIIGFDIDVANYITSELGYELDIQDMDFSGLVPAVDSERVDFVLSAMTPTPEREKNVDFSDIYYDSKHLIVSNDNNKLTQIEDMEGKIIGVQLGSVQEVQAKDLIEEGINFEIKPLNKIPDLVQELLSQRIDGAIIEETVAKGHLEKNDNLFSFLLETGDSQGSAIAFPKGSPLKEEFNPVIQKMKDNGKLEELVNKWFGDVQEQ